MKIVCIYTEKTAEAFLFFFVAAGNHKCLLTMAS